MRAPTNAGLSRPATMAGDVAPMIKSHEGLASERCGSRISSSMSRSLPTACVNLTNAKADQRLDDDFTLDDANVPPWIEEHLVPAVRTRRPVRPFGSAPHENDREARKVTAARVVPATGDRRRPRS
jgi:hypothetical protein